MPPETRSICRMDKHSRTRSWAAGLGTMEVYEEKACLRVGNSQIRETTPRDEGCQKSATFATSGLTRRSTCARPARRARGL